MDVKQVGCVGVVNTVLKFRVHGRRGVDQLSDY
jgi:hypothetical protein